MLDYAEEVSNERNTYYSAFIGGSAIEEMDYFVDNGIPFSLLVKLGKDMQGETHLDYITSEYGIEEDDVLYSSAPSSISMEGTLLVKLQWIQSVDFNKRIMGGENYFICFDFPAFCVCCITLYIFNKRIFPDIKLT